MNNPDNIFQYLVPNNWDEYSVDLFLKRMVI